MFGTIAGTLDTTVSPNRVYQAFPLHFLQYETFEVAASSESAIGCSKFEALCFGGKEYLVKYYCIRKWHPGSWFSERRLGYAVLFTTSVWSGRES